MQGKSNAKCIYLKCLHLRHDSKRAYFLRNPARQASSGPPA